ncbi:hypothetical protein FDECE_13056 [Fusarium decemcellulare]|nr:hypothetical protein FDECE_13056 [Fusarium decemcellulare]
MSAPNRMAISDIGSVAPSFMTEFIAKHPKTKNEFQRNWEAHQMLMIDKYKADKNKSKKEEKDSEKTPSSSSPESDVDDSTVAELGAAAANDALVKKRAAQIGPDCLARGCGSSQASNMTLHLDRCRHLRRRERVREGNWERSRSRTRGCPTGGGLLQQSTLSLKLVLQYLAEIAISKDDATDVGEKINPKETAMLSDGVADVAPCGGAEAPLQRASCISISFVSPLVSSSSFFSEKHTSRLSLDVIPHRLDLHLHQPWPQPRRTILHRLTRPAPSLQACAPVNPPRGAPGPFADKARRRRCRAKLPTRHVNTTVTAEIDHVLGSQTLVHEAQPQLHHEPAPIPPSATPCKRRYTLDVNYALAHDYGPVRKRRRVVDDLDDPSPTLPPTPPHQTGLVLGINQNQKASRQAARLHSQIIASSTKVKRLVGRGSLPVLGTTACSHSGVQRDSGGDHDVAGTFDYDELAMINQRSASPNQECNSGDGIPKTVTVPILSNDNLSTVRPAHKKRNGETQFGTGYLVGKGPETTEFPEAQPNIHSAVATNGCDAVREGVASQRGTDNPETGEFNWDCSCLGGMAHGSCGDEFKAALCCFVRNEGEGVYS